MTTITTFVKFSLKDHIRGIPIMNYKNDTETVCDSCDTKNFQCWKLPI